MKQEEAEAARTWQRILTACARLDLIAEVHGISPFTIMINARTHDEKENAGAADDGRLLGTLLHECDDFKSAEAWVNGWEKRGEPTPKPGEDGPALGPRLPDSPPEEDKEKVVEASRDADQEAGEKASADDDGDSDDATYEVYLHGSIPMEDGPRELTFWKSVDPRAFAQPVADGDVLFVHETSELLWAIVDEIQHNIPMVWCTVYADIRTERKDNAMGIEEITSLLEDGWEVSKDSPVNEEEAKELVAGAA
jgi:hypothetical protein